MPMGMRRSQAAACLLALTAVALVAVGPAAGQWSANMAELMDSELLRPFVIKVMSVQACLGDKALSSFDVKQCPGLLSMLDALQLGNPNPPAVCDLPCAIQFAQLNVNCTSELRAVFGDELTDIGRLLTDFFASCDEVLPPMLSDSSAPAPAPAAAAGGVAEKLRRRRVV